MCVAVSALTHGQRSGASACIARCGGRDSACALPSGLGQNCAGSTQCAGCTAAFHCLPGASCSSQLSLGCFSSLRMASPSGTAGAPSPRLQALCSPTTRCAHRCARPVRSLINPHLQFGALPPLCGCSLRPSPCPACRCVQVQPRTHGRMRSAVHGVHTQCPIGSMRPMPRRLPRQCRVRRQLRQMQRCCRCN